ncbi:hypothetical protein ACWFRK_23070 [Streptomyces sp. NPDC055157]
MVTGPAGRGPHRPGGGAPGAGGGGVEETLAAPHHPHRSAAWNLYFRAHAVLAEIAVSRDKGMEVFPVRDAEAARIARTMLRAAVAGHVLTAAVVFAVTWATGEFTGYWFAAFFLLSTFFRPASAYLGQLRRRLGTQPAWWACVLRCETAR